MTTLYPPRRMTLRVRSLAVATAALFASSAASQTLLDRQEQRDRAQRDAEARADQRNAPEVRLESQDVAPHRIDLPAEAQCLRFSAIRLDGAHAREFAFAQRYLDRYAGRCVGPKGVQAIRARTAALIANRGYVTTRIALPEQAVAPGVLRLAVLPGTVGNIRLAHGSQDETWRTAFPIRPGDLLNLRDIEQGLEQIKRLSSQDANVDIAPGRLAGESDLVIAMRRSRPWHVVATLDDTGSRATGRLQAGLNLALDNPLRLNDLLSVGINRNLPASSRHGTRGTNASYSVPMGHWLFTASLYDYAYRQTVVGYWQTFATRGKSRTVDLAAQRVGKRWATE
ncbi:POTRA domain-containing ShlB-type protein [Luteibacter rhizovicinus]|uniref:POTRA domain-containing ShlB-type protein n=1 Tax=Luteibacter rhizovicinus TaxID=242606 RepID=A0A4R3YWL5_9GAMM|nr:ShlB/FhaC/HecB family hemolysin secretion/activation protein [Luteibacter rhizovicinus]TCV95673.1 POTRA domain-containing ShlB-type protein [Luteibacter rhizovicinus]